MILLATKVFLNEKQNLEDALKDFRRQVQRDQIFKEVKKREFFMTRRERLFQKKKTKKWT